MDPRVLSAIRRIYPNGISASDLERALTEIEAFASALHQNQPVREMPPSQNGPGRPPKKLVISPTIEAAPKRGRGRPPGAKNKPKAAASKTQARAAPRAEAEDRGDPEAGSEPLNSDLADQALAILNRGPATLSQLQEELHLGSMSPAPLLVRIGARPVGEVELEDGSVFKTYGLPPQQ